MNLLMKSLLAVLVFVAACTKDQTSVAPPAHDLLTQKEWILSNYGYDDNGNGAIDAAEESIADCEKDNVYVFNSNGTGIHYENILSCANGITEQPFTWKLINNGTSIDFSFGIAKIVRLDESELIISDISVPIRFMTVFRH